MKKTLNELQKHLRYKKITFILNTEDVTITQQHARIALQYSTSLPQDLINRTITHNFKMGEKIS